MSNECCLEAVSNDGLPILPRDIGREKLYVGRARREPPKEYSEFKDGDLPWTWTKGESGERGSDSPLLDDCFRCNEKDDPLVDALSSSSELSTGIDRTLLA